MLPARGSRRRPVGGGLGVEIAGLVDRLQRLAAQEDHLRGQPAARRDPALYRRRIHRVKHLGGFGVGHGAAVGAEIPGSVKAEIGRRGNADAVMRNGAEHDGAGRGAETIDDHGLAGRTQALILVDISADAAAAIIRDPYHCVTGAHPCQKENRRKQTSHELHVEAPSPSRNRIRTSFVMPTITACCRTAFLSRGPSALKPNSNAVLQRRCTVGGNRSQTGTVNKFLRGAAATGKRLLSLTATKVTGFMRSNTRERKRWLMMPT